MAEATDGTGGGLDLFLEWAGRTGELNPNTANALRSTAGKVLSVHENEIDQIDITRLDPEALLARWENLNRTNYSHGSLNTYKSRFRQSVAMYKAWLVKDASWKQAGKSNGTGTKTTTKSTKSTTKSTATKKAKTSTPDPQSTAQTEDVVPQGVRMVAYDLPLRPDLLVRLTLPVDLTKADAGRISAFVSSLAFGGGATGASPEQTTEGG